MRIFFCLTIFALGYFEPLFSQSQFVKFDSVLLRETANYQLNKEDREKAIKNHQVIAIMPAVVSRFKGMFKPYPLDSNLRKSTSFRVQQMTYHTLNTASKRDTPRINVQPLNLTNYILDSLYEALPQANVYDIVKALRVDAILIPEYQISVPRTGTYAVAGGLILASAVLGGGRNYSNMAQTTSTLNYYVKDANMDLLFSIFPTTEQRLIVDPNDDFVPKQNISTSELRKLPYVEHRYRIKNDRTRKIVNTSSKIFLGMVLMAAYAYSLSTQ